MFGIFQKKFSEINFQDIQELITNAERENQFLDYKQIIDRGNIDDIVADVCAMANAQGGYIIGGISEKEKPDDGYPEEIIGIENAEAIAMSLKDKVRDLIDPYIFGFLDRIIQTPDGKEILLIQIPDSPQKPHFVKSNKTLRSPFPIRVGRTKSYLFMDQVKNQIINTYFNEQKMQILIENLHNNNYLLRKEYAEPFFHFLAIPSLQNINSFDIFTEKIRNFINLPGNYSSQWISQYGTTASPSIEGIRNEYLFESLKQSVFNYSNLQLHRDGILEYTKNFSLTQNHSVRFEVFLNLIGFSYIFAHLCQELKIFSPITYIIKFYNLAGTSFANQDGVTITSFDGIIEFRENISSIFEEQLPFILGKRFLNAYKTNILPNDIENKIINDYKKIIN